MQAQEVVERYCPYCHRWLATLQPDGSLDLAGRASMVGPAFALFTKAVVRGPVAQVPLRFGPSFEAKCLRPLCRLRAWYDGA
jgi:hypothetical protein